MPRPSLAALALWIAAGSCGPTPSRPTKAPRSRRKPVVTTAELTASVWQLSYRRPGRGAEPVVFLPDGGVVSTRTIARWELSGPDLVLINRPSRYGVRRIVFDRRVRRDGRAYLRGRPRERGRKGSYYLGASGPAGPRAVAKVREQAMDAEQQRQQRRERLAARRREADKRDASMRGALRTQRRSAHGGPPVTGRRLYGPGSARRWVLRGPRGVIADNFWFSCFSKERKRGGNRGWVTGAGSTLQRWRIAGQFLEIDTRSASYRFHRRTTGPNMRLEGVGPDGKPVVLVARAVKRRRPTVRPSKNPVNLYEQQRIRGPIYHDTSTNQVRCPAGYKFRCGSTCCNTSTCCGNMCWNATRSCPWGHPRSMAQQVL